MTKINWPDPTTLEWDRRKADLKNEPRAMIRVVVSSANPVHIGSYRAKQGDQFLLVYKSDLPAIRKLLPTADERARLKMAEERFAMLLEAHIQSICGQSPTASDRARAEETARKTIGASVQSEYHRLSNPIPERSPVRGYPPIDGLEIWEGEVAPPETPAGIAERQAASMTDALTRALEKIATTFNGGAAAKAR